MQIAKTQTTEESKIEEIGIETNKSNCKCKNVWTYYVQITGICICAIIAISIAIYTIPVIKDNNKDINTMGMMRFKLEELNNHIGSHLLPLSTQSWNTTRIIINNNFKYLQKYLLIAHNKYNINIKLETQLLNNITINYNKFIIKIEDFYTRIFNLNDKRVIIQYFYNNIAKISHVKLQPKLNTIVNRIEQEANNKSMVIIYITIAFGCFELLGVIFLLRNIHKLINAETNVSDMQLSLVKKETENEVQNNIISMLSHDLKGSAVNIVGELTLLEDKLSENDTHKDQINRTIYEAVHIQKCIRSLQIKSEIIAGIYKSKFKDFNLYKLLEIFNYKFKKLLKINIPENCSLYSNEDVFYNIFQNAIKNGIKHGELNKFIDLNILYNNDTDTIDIQIINNPGKNHKKNRDLQEVNGENWLFTGDYDLSSLNIGTLDSTFKGLNDMKLLANAIDARISLIFNEYNVVFTLSLPNKIAQCNINDNVIIEIPEHMCNKQEQEKEQEIYYMGIDDQNISRIFLFKMAKQINVKIEAEKIETNELKGQMYRNEEYIKIFGRNAGEVKIDEINEIAKSWNNKASIVVLDQNIDYTSEIIYGTDITKMLRNNGFNGVILIRSANDNDSDENEYIEVGADGVLSKTITIKNSEEIINKWRNEAIRRAKII